MKYFRLKKKKEITKVLKVGKRVYHGSLTIVYFSSERTKLAVCVGKKYGKSVMRNRIKRLLREAFSSLSSSIFPAASFLLIPKEAENYSFFTFQKDLRYLLKKEHFFEAEV